MANSMKIWKFERVLLNWRGILNQKFQVINYEKNCTSVSLCCIVYFNIL